jgi:predicted transcriptional regulator
MQINQTLGPLERDVLKIIWAKQRATVQDVLGALNQTTQNHTLAYTTVMTIMTRLVEKNILSREKEGRCFCYFPREHKNVFVHGLVKKTMQSMINRFGDEAVVAFLAEAKMLSQSEKTSLIKKIETSK